MTIYCHVVLSFVDVNNTKDLTSSQRNNDDSNTDIIEQGCGIVTDKMIIGELIKDAAKLQAKTLAKAAWTPTMFASEAIEKVFNDNNNDVNDIQSPSHNDESDHGSHDEDCQQEQMNDRPSFISTESHTSNYDPSPAQEEEEEEEEHDEDDDQVVDEDYSDHDTEEKESDDYETNRLYKENWIRQVSPTNDEAKNDTTNHHGQNRLQYVVRYSRAAFLQSLLIDNEGEDGDLYDYAMRTTTTTVGRREVIDDDESENDKNDDVDRGDTTSTPCSSGQKIRLLGNQFWDRPLWAWSNVERQFVAGHLAARDLRKSIIENMNKRLDGDSSPTLLDKSYHEKKLQDVKVLVTNSDCPNHIHHFPWNDMVCQQTIEPNVALLLVQEPGNDRQRHNAGTVSTSDPIVSITDLGMSSGEAISSDEQVLNPIITPTKVVEESDSHSGRSTDAKPLVTQSPAHLSEAGSNYPESYDELPRTSTKKTPQIDSTGLDLTTLSELPPRIRSEIRAAQVLKERQQRKKRRRDSSFLGSWLSTFDPKQPKCQNNSRSRLIKTKTNESQRQVLPLPPRREQKKSIVDFFGNKFG